MKVKMIIGVLAICYIFIFLKDWLFNGCYETSSIFRNSAIATNAYHFVSGAAIIEVALQTFLCACPRG